MKIARLQSTLIYMYTKTGTGHINQGRGVREYRSFIKARNCRNYSNSNVRTLAHTHTHTACKKQDDRRCVAIAMQVVTTVDSGVSWLCCIHIRTCGARGGHKVKLKLSCKSQVASASRKSQHVPCCLLRVACCCCWLD
jgi:hypothetical protein